MFVIPGLLARLWWDLESRFYSSLSVKGGWEGFSQGFLFVVPNPEINSGQVLFWHLYL